uniref:Glycosyl transferase 64 domain-containing protein n=1 Tax=Seriola lalandi dorsalis TaxID=1841481 RepID=A0A3B4WWY3_SERLL
LRVHLDASTFTLLISTHSRFELLSEQLSYYSASPMISTIVVTWHNMNIKAPPDARVNGTYIRFESPTTDSLNNRFQPLAYITTEAVFILDDIKLHLQDMHNMFAAWKENKQNLVGASPRWVDGGSSEPGSGGRASAPHNLAYLTQSELRSLILSIVAAEFNCEDIGMNFVVNAARSSANPPGADAAPLFVRPLHRIGDFGKMGDTGLHQKKSHTTARTDCLNQMNRAFWQATGQTGLLHAGRLGFLSERGAMCR